MEPNRTDEGFLIVEIDSEMIEQAQSKAIAMGKLRNSIREGQGNLAGFLGEAIVVKAFPEVTAQNTHHHDALWGSARFEIKTKDRTVAPLLDYEASVTRFNPDQQADYYIHTSLRRVNGVYTRGYLCGIISVHDYFKSAVCRRKGEEDPNSSVRFVFTADCFNLAYSEMTRL